MSRLASLPLLEQLMVKGNPFTASPSYRQHVFSLLPKIARQVRRIILFDTLLYTMI